MIDLDYLRRQVAESRKSQNGPPELQTDLTDDLEDAVDEIERLRAEVADAHMFAYKALPDRKKREESLCGQIHRLREHIERLQAIVDRLPITADGVSLVPLYDKCYAIINGIVEACFINGCEYSRGWVAKPCRRDVGYSIEIVRCYSTREAAEVAKEKQNG